jgi:hypothetical protein
VASQVPKEKREMRREEGGERREEGEGRRRREEGGGGERVLTFVQVTVAVLPVSVQPNFVRFFFNDENSVIYVVHVNLGPTKEKI